jgi:hypothetical protein
MGRPAVFESLRTPRRQRRDHLVNLWISRVNLWANNQQQSVHMHGCVSHYPQVVWGGVVASVSSVKTERRESGPHESERKARQAVIDELVSAIREPFDGRRRSGFPDPEGPGGRPLMGLRSLWERDE